MSTKKQANGRNNARAKTLVAYGTYPTGALAAVYQALRPTSCHECGAVVNTGDVFTRHPVPQRGQRACTMVPFCRTCRPFQEESNR